MMDYGLLWILAMLTSLFITAFVVTLFSSVKKRLWRWLGLLAVIGVLTFIFGIASLITGLMYYNNLIIPSWLFPYTTSFSIIYLIAAILIWRKGLSAKAGTPPARGWKKIILASSMLIGIILTLITYTLIDLNRQIEFSNVNSDLKTRLQGIWPSKPLSHLNAYPLYEQVSNALDEKERDRIRDYVKPDHNALAPEIVELLSRNQQLIDTLHQASNRPFHFWGSPIDTCILALFEFPRFPEYRQLAGLLGLKAKAETLSDNPAGAVKELTVIRSMAKHLQSSPNLILWLYSHIVAKQESDYMEYLLAQTQYANGLFPFPIKNTPSILQSCKGLMVNETAIGVQLPFLMMQQREVIEHFVRTYSEMLHSFGASPPISMPYILHPLPRSLWRVFIGQSYVDNIRDKWDVICKINESGYKHWRDFSALEKGLEGKRVSLMYLILNHPFGGDIHLGILSYIHRIIRIDVYHQLIDLAIAASAYLEAKGSYPEAVDDLVPGYLEIVPMDLYDGKPLKIKKVQGGLDLYSVGLDPKDLEESSRWGGPIHFYLGRKAYEKYRIQPAKIKRAQEEEERKERERKRLEWEKKRKREPGAALKKKPKRKRK
jgi:hypothetical protein